MFALTLIAVSFGKIVDDVFLPIQSPEAAGSCSDTDDQTKWNSDGQTNFAKDLEKCGRKCVGRATCTATCIAKTGYTQPCSTCFGELTGCTKKHCKFNCMTNSKGPKCKKCVDTHCTGDFTTCSGLTPPASEEAFTWLEDLEALEAIEAGSCMDADDQTKWNADGSNNFAKDLEKCGRKCVGRTTCTATCMAKTGYTQPCSTCFGELTGCTKKHCKFNCMTNSKGPKCKKCVEEHGCTEDFTTCSGLTPPPSVEFTFLEAVEADAGACMDADDQTKWTTDGSTNFASDLETCGRNCVGGVDCTTKCIGMKGYTNTCAACFGTLTGCSKDHCMFDCMLNSKSTKCKNCVDKYCTDSFKTCSGLTPPPSR